MLDIVNFGSLNYLIEAFNAPHMATALGDTTVSLDQAITNLQLAFKNLRSLLGAVSYVMGIIFIYKGVVGYKIFATQTMSSMQKGELAGPMVYLVVGAAMVYLPSTLDTSMGTLFAGKGIADVSPASDLIGYAALTDNTNWAQLAPILVEYMKLIGLFAFVRGWVILSKLGHSGGQPGSMGKGIVHIIAGILLMNIIDTVNYLAATFGFVS